MTYVKGNIIMNSVSNEVFASKVFIFHVTRKLTLEEDHTSIIAIPN
eukprot:CAMPEP_0172430910 /NCGR_PEP_ID=MMETSP1064-20121228/56556_1 /TAXON_ID=202472 /ORGANISM="Aulacoseira subarctica , Strain CCAP 1002/5" /LENGTH=45 /DNA_ID= /DNA_START= /DNA_END= /DNA_ORIENTATION=